MEEMKCMPTEMLAKDERSMIDLLKETSNLINESAGVVHRLSLRVIGEDPPSDIILKPADNMMDDMRNNAEKLSWQLKRLYHLSDILGVKR